MQMAYVAKISPIALPAGSVVQIEERTMYGGKAAVAGDRIYIWTSELQGGSGLTANGYIVSADASGGRTALEVQVETGNASSFGIEEIAPYRDIEDGSAISGIAHKLYRHAHNKVCAISEPEADLLESHFS